MDWWDIILHCGIAALLVGVAGAIGVQWYVAPLIAAGFLLREALQDRTKRGVWRWPWVWSTQKLAEGFGPVAVALGGAILASTAG